MAKAAAVDDADDGDVDDEKILCEVITSEPNVKGPGPSPSPGPNPGANPSPSPCLVSNVASSTPLLSLAIPENTSPGPDAADPGPSPVPCAFPLFECPLVGLCVLTP